MLLLLCPFCWSTPLLVGSAGLLHLRACVGVGVGVLFWRTGGLADPKQSEPLARLGAQVLGVDATGLFRPSARRAGVPCVHGACSAAMHGTYQCAICACPLMSLWSTGHAAVADFA